jgi:NADH-quinone oxidoreductase subunit J
MFLFFVFAAIAIAAAAGVVLSRKPVYSALFLLLNFVTLAALYIMLQAQFLAAVQIIVYAGAIVVLFLFVLMLIGGGNLEDASLGKNPLRSQLFAARVSALVLCVLLVAGVAYGVLTGQLGVSQTTAQAFGAGSVEAIGQTLYTDYLLPFELASVLLLVGMVGAVALARKE